jgi:hypothetical protein
VDEPDHETISNQPEATVADEPVAPPADPISEIVDVVKPNTSIQGSIGDAFAAIGAKIESLFHGDPSGLGSFGASLREKSPELTAAVMSGTMPPSGSTTVPGGVPAANEVAQYLMDKNGIDAAEANSKTAPGSNL